jgi:hypothetical protein
MVSNVSKVSIPHSKKWPRLYPPAEAPCLRVGGLGLPHLAQLAGIASSQMLLLDILESRFDK